MTAAGAGVWTVLAQATTARPRSRARWPMQTDSSCVPAGDYHLAAADDVEPGEWFDPSFLQRLLPGAVRVTIGEGERKVQDIRPGGG